MKVAHGILRCLFVAHKCLNTPPSPSMIDTFSTGDVFGSTQGVKSPVQRILQHMNNSTGECLIAQPHGRYILVVDPEGGGQV